MELWILINTSEGTPWEYHEGHPSVEGTYGHEQRHVLNLMRFARDLYNGQIAPMIAGALGKNFGAGQEGKLKCRIFCQQVTLATVPWREVFNREVGHDEEDTREPFAGKPYPPIGKVPGSPSNLPSDKEESLIIDIPF